jgi:hypothetical protein
MKTLSVTPRSWYCWKADILSFLYVLIDLGVKLTSLLTTTHQSGDFELRYGCKTIIEHTAKAPQMSRIQEKNTLVVRPAHVMSTSMIPTSPSEKKQSSTHNQKPQLGPQHRHHHDKVRENGISYAVGLMRDIANCQICLVNRKTDIIASMTLHVGIEEIWEVQCMFDPHFLAKELTPMGLLPQILR